MLILFSLNFSCERWLFCQRVTCKSNITTRAWGRGYPIPSCTSPPLPSCTRLPSLVSRSSCVRRRGYPLLVPAPNTCSSVTSQDNRRYIHLHATYHTHRRLPWYLATLLPYLATLLPLFCYLASYPGRAGEGKAAWYTFLSNVPCSHFSPCSLARATPFLIRQEYACNTCFSERLSGYVHTEWVIGVGFFLFYLNFSVWLVCYAHAQFLLYPGCAHAQFLLYPGSFQGQRKEPGTHCMGMHTFVPEIQGNRILLE